MNLLLTYRRGLFLAFLRGLCETSAPSAGNALAVACSSPSSWGAAGAPIGRSLPEWGGLVKAPRIGTCFLYYLLLTLYFLPSLFPVIDSALASTTARSGDWLACRPGCHQCCIGVFPISSLDAETLRTALHSADPALSARIKTRAAASRARLTPNFPGDPTTGQLFTEPHHEDAFEDFANDERCPILDPATGTCDLYAARPVQCRTFGPPVRDADDHLTVCELCFVNAPPEEVARCEMDQSWRTLEDDLIAEAEQRTGLHGPTIIAFALDKP